MTPPETRTEQLRRVAREVAAELPPDPDWPARGAWPRADWIAHCRAAGWPTRTETIALPTRGHAGKLAQQPVTVVPVAWLRAMADRVGLPWPKACRGIVG